MTEIKKFKCEIKLYMHCIGLVVQQNIIYIILLNKHLLNKTMIVDIYIAPFHSWEHECSRHD